MFQKLFGSDPRNQTPEEFSKLSARFVLNLGETFSSNDEAQQLWPMSDERDTYLRKFWEITAANFGPKAQAFHPGQLAIQMMKEAGHVIGFILLPTLPGSVCFSAAVWLFGPFEPEQADPFGAATARFFAMAEEAGSSSQARIYEVAKGQLVELGLLASPDPYIFLDTIVNRYLKGQSIATVKTGDPDMAAAMQTAGSLVPYFIDILTRYPNVEHYSVKVRIEDDEEVEYFWLENTRWESGLFRGTLGNDPTRVKSVAYGQRVTVPPDGVCDWYYFWEGKMRGNYTLRASLPFMDPAQAAKLGALLDES